MKKSKNILIENSKVVGELKNVPKNVSFLSSIPNQDFQRTKIVLNWTNYLQHGFINNLLDDSHYDDYLMTTTFSDKMQRLQENQLENLLSISSNHQISSLVEIGCGDGSFLLKASKRLDHVIGIEPSQRFAKEAIMKNLNVLIGYVNSSNLITQEKFDAFVSRQVFEHIVDPLDVLIGIRKMLKIGAVGLIEVPNGFQSLMQGRFYEIFPDHIHYYSVNSLVSLATEADFNVVSCNESFDGDYLELWLRYYPEIDNCFNDLINCMDKTIKFITEKSLFYNKQNKKVAIWGCGAKTLSIINICSKKVLRVISCVIDSDPHKHDKFVPNSSIPVISVNDAKKYKPDVIFIFAFSYKDEIELIIKKELPFCKTIFTIDNHGTFIRL